MDTSTSSIADTIKIGLIGNPNSGKTSLFNALTGSNYKVANYPGVTVEYKEARLEVHGQKYIFVDLPGIYSLKGASAEEQITCQQLQDKDNGFDLIIAVLDSCNLERNLFLMTEIVDQGFKTIAALSMSDLAAKKDIFVRERVLSNKLGLPVVKLDPRAPSSANELWTEIQNQLKTKSSLPKVKDAWQPYLVKSSNSAEGVLNAAHVDEAAARYALIADLLRESLVCASCPQSSRAQFFDNLISHRVWGLLFFAAVMFAMFQSVFNLAAAPMGWIEDGVSWLGNLVSSILPEGLVTSLIVDGIIAGVGSVLVFVPQIFILFVLIGLLEDSAYLTRAAFLMDRLMRCMGLQGRAFIPLLNSFACAIPGITATRTISSRKDRLITIMIAPLMSCSARLPIYTVLIAAFIPNILVAGLFPLQGLMMFGLYMLGIIAAILVAIALKIFLGRGETSLFVFEMPTLRRPSLRLVLRQAYDRVVLFVKNAGGFIMACSILLWVLSSFPQPTADMSSSEAVKQSYAGQLGQLLEPAIKPLGYNWEIAIGIIASLAAREVFVSALATVYNLQDESDQASSLTELLADRAALGQGFSLATALSLLVFYVFACQCFSTLAVCRKETNSWRWTVFMFSYMTVLAYVAAWITFKLASML